MEFNLNTTTLRIQIISNYVVTFISSIQKPLIYLINCDIIFVLFYPRLKLMKIQKTQ